MRRLGALGDAPAPQEPPPASGDAPAPQATLRRVMRRRAAVNRRSRDGKRAWPATEAVVDLAVAEALGIAAQGIGGDDLAPELHRTGISLIFDDLPLTREAVEDQRSGISADADMAVFFSHEELGHEEIHERPARGRNSGPRDQGEADRFGAPRDEQRMRMVVRKPVCKNFVLLSIGRTQTEEIARVQVRQGLYVLAVDFLDPLSIFAGALAVANADGH